MPRLPWPVESIASSQYPISFLRYLQKPRCERLTGRSLLVDISVWKVWSGDGAGSKGADRSWKEGWSTRSTLNWIADLKSPSDGLRLHFYIRFP